jgi:hypothetical protein
MIAVAIRSVYFHYKVSVSLDKALRELDQSEPGWRLEDIEAARREIPEERNSARFCVAASKLLPQGWPSLDLTEAFDHIPPQEKISAASAKRLGKELEAVQPALNEARKLANMPEGHHRIHYKPNPYDTMLDDQQEVRRVCWLLRRDAMRHDHAGDLKSAMTSCRAALNSARSIGDEPIGISQLIRIACVHMSCQAVERTLAQGQPSEDDLLLIQRSLEEEDQFNAALVGARGDRAINHSLFDAFEKGEVRLSQFSGNERTPPTWNEELLGWRFRDNIRAEHPLLLSMTTRRVVEAQRPLHEQVETDRRLAGDVHDLPSEAIFTRILLTGMNRLGEAYRRRHTCVRCMATTLTVERYRLVHGIWPDSLDKLVPEFLAAVPLDPWDGSPLRYRRLGDGVVIYSLGVDLVDNGGVLDRDNSAKPGVDIGYRLWDVKHRRQPPHPVAPPAIGEGVPPRE